MRNQNRKTRIEENRAPEEKTQLQIEVEHAAGIWKSIWKSIGGNKEDMKVGWQVKAIIMEDDDSKGPRMKLIDKEFQDAFSDIEGSEGRQPPEQIERGGRMGKRLKFRTAQLLF